MNRKISVARLSVLSNSLLIALKVTVGVLGGSVSILSEAIHSVDSPSGSGHLLLFREIYS